MNGWVDASIARTHGRLRATARLAAVVATTRRHLAAMPEDAGLQQRADRARRWARELAVTCAVQVVVEGQRPPPGCLVVANHRSYIDIVALLSRIEAVFLAKHKVSTWPVIGPGARAAGTIFVRRAHRTSRQAARAALAGLLDAGVRAIVFPEGTTTAAPRRRPYRPGVFELAAAAGAPVVPVAIEYPDVDDAWVGDDGFVGHFLRRFGRPVMPVHLRFGPILTSDDAADLRWTVERWTDESLLALQRRLWAPPVEEPSHATESPIRRRPVPGQALPPSRAHADA